MEETSLSYTEFFPYEKMRPIQREVLEILSEQWANFDVFIISAPTAFGKTALARTLQNALYSVSVITPTNQLVEQYREEFPDTPTLARLDSYYCAKWDRPCPITRAKTRNFCNIRRDDCSCRASTELSIAKYRKGPGIYNYYTYLAHKLHREVLVVDEAHNLIPTIRDRQSLLIWSHDYKFPSKMFTREQMGQWVTGLPTRIQKHKKIRLLQEAVTFDVPLYIAQRTQEEFSGKGTLRGQPEMRDCIRLSPVDISTAPPMFWPHDTVKKVVLMSATIGEKDTEQLGLGGRRRVMYLDCASPLTPDRRPIIPLNTCSVNRNNMLEIVPRLAEEIQGIAAYHAEERGVIHATYQLSSLLREHLTDDRYLFHTRENKKEKYEEFRSCGGNKILVACGMYEGIDLPGDLGRWQVIAKIPWPSLGNPAIKHLAELDPDWFLWEAAKTTIQAAGRISRTETDFGITYVLDSSFNRLYTEGEHLLPSFFKEAIIWPQQQE